MHEPVGSFQRRERAAGLPIFHRARILTPASLSPAPVAAFEMGRDYFPFLSVLMFQGKAEPVTSISMTCDGPIGDFLIYMNINDVGVRQGCRRR